jgi:hypothetical protein
MLNILLIAAVVVVVIVVAVLGFSPSSLVILAGMLNPFILCEVY